MEEAGESGRAGWGTAIALTLAVLLLSVFDALALVLLPLAILMVGLPEGRRPRWVAIGLVLWVLALVLSGGPFSLLSQGWALVLGAGYLAVTMARPDWDVTSRALLALGTAALIGVLGLLVTGQGGELDHIVRTHFETLATITVGDLQARMPDSEWVAELRGTTERISAIQSDLFPALLALQSLTALALASWWVRRLGRSDRGAFKLDRLRDFRFNDQLIWLMIAALVLYLLPLAPVGDRVAVNVILFMVVLYALRGFAVFVFLATGSRSVVTMLLGVVALVFLYPVAFTAALLMGVGDTWLDVRRRVASANPT